MGHSIKTLCHERLSSNPPTNMAMPDTNNSLVNVPKRKKHIAISKEIAIPRTITFPTPKTPIRHLFKTPITLTIGPQSTPFPLHLEALLSISPFFTATFNPHYNFLESHTSTLSLPTHNPQDFEYFVQWLYTRTLTHESLDGPHPAYFRLIRLWKMADWLQVPGLKNGIVDEMAKRADATNSVPTPDDTRSVFGEEVGGRVERLAELILDLFVWKKTDSLVQTHPDSWDERFLRELVGRLKRREGEGEAPWRNARTRCERYHEHDEWAPMCEGLGGEDVGTTVSTRPKQARRKAITAAG